MQTNAPGGNKPRRARSRRGHLLESHMIRWNHHTESLASQAGCCCCCGWHQSVWDGGDQCRGSCGPSQKRQLLTALLPPSIQAGAASPAPRGSSLPLPLHPSCTPFPFSLQKGSQAPSSPPWKGQDCISRAHRGCFRLAPRGKNADGG